MDVTVVVNEALISEIKRLRAENAELQNELTKGIHTCGPTCRKTPRCAEMADLRAELAAYESSPVLATLGPCCGIIRIGDQPEGVVHSGACRFGHAGVLGPTIKLIARKGEGE